MIADSRLVILMYHRVLPEFDPLRPDDVTLRVFSRCMRTLKRFFNVLPLCEAVERLKTGTLPRRAVSITFDDGYADNAISAAPVLASLSLPATVFVASGYLDGGRMWNDAVIETIRRNSDDFLDFDGIGRLPLGDTAERLRAIDTVLKHLKHLPLDERHRQVRALAGHSKETVGQDLMMTSAQVAALTDSGIDVGAHTVRHPILATLPEAAASEEIVESKSALEKITGREVVLFAYPNGRPGVDYRDADVKTVQRSGFKAAVSTSWGSAGRESDLYQLPRIGPWDRSGWRLALRIEKTRLFDKNAGTVSA